MTRSNITGSQIDVLSDDGALIISVVQGEQLAFQVTAGWLTNLTGFTITAQAVEAANVLDDTGIPVEEEATPVITSLPIIDDTVTDNIFKVVIPATLADSWAVGPQPDNPVYAYFGVQIADTGVGNAQQIWHPLRGVIEVRYSALEAS